MEAITADIYDRILEELKIDMDMLLLNDPRLSAQFRGPNNSKQSTLFIQ